MARVDPHSYFDDAQPRTARWHLGLEVDFATKTLKGSVTLHFVSPGAGALDLDTRGLGIESVTTADGRAVPYVLHPEDPVLGQRLALTLPSGTPAVTVVYRTSPESSALQWLSAAQTQGKQHPFLFSQCQAVHARALVPCQDCAVARVTYLASVTVPGSLSAVMSAGPAGDELHSDGRKTFRFDMPQSIPPYLLALAVGHLESRELGPRTRVWAEPGTVEKAAWEFQEVEPIIQKAESLFGPYPWERFDLLVLPPSFPYGGMENPRMTFLTPTLLAGDRSLVDVVAHELAHSWTGNLVTNATNEHFWLNEGWTVWAERRILEALHGEEAAKLSWAVGLKALEDALARFTEHPELTALRTHLEGKDPDEVFSTVPYEKGARFIALLERTAGRKRFDVFVREYMDAFKFGTITTEAFVQLVKEKLPGVLEKVDAPAWLDGPGLPKNAPDFRSAKLDALEAMARTWKEGRRPSDAERKAWTPQELVLYLQRLPRPLSIADCAWLDDSLKLTAQGNMEILVEWLCIAAQSDYEPAFARVREVLLEVGRVKYLRPLYMALGTSARTQALAKEVFSVAAPGYHLLGRRVVQGIVDAYPR
jgi:aminopeptidase N